MIGELAVPHSVLRQVVGAGVEHAEVLLPRGTALHVEGVEPLRSEERDDVLAVGKRRGVGVSRLDVPLLLWHALVRRLPPHGLARPAIERHHDPLLRRAVLGCRSLAVEPRLEGDAGAAADRARHEDPVAPDNRARMGKAGNRNLPADVGTADPIPRVGETLTIGDAGRGRATEPRPVVAGCREKSCCSAGCSDAQNKKGARRTASGHIGPI